jgi:hypothetical protein
MDYWLIVTVRSHRSGSLSTLTSRLDIDQSRVRRRHRRSGLPSAG